MVIVDRRLTKRVMLIPAVKTFSTEDTANVFIDWVYWRFGFSDVIISDRGPQFASKVFQEMGRLLEIELRMSTAYICRQTARWNRQIKN